MKEEPPNHSSAKTAPGSEAWIRDRLASTDDIPIPDREEQLETVKRRLQQEPEARPVLRFPRLAQSPFYWKAAAGMAVLLCVGWLLVSWGNRSVGAPAGRVLWVETHLPDSSTMVYEAEEVGMTVIWMVTDSEEEPAHESG